MRIHKKITILLIIGLVVSTNVFSQNMTWNSGSSTIIPDTIEVGDTTVFTTSFSETGGVAVGAGQLRVEIEVFNNIQGNPGNPPSDGGFFTWTYDPDGFGLDKWGGVNNFPINANTQTPNISITYTGVVPGSFFVSINSVATGDINIFDNGGGIPYTVIASTLPIRLVDYTAEAVGEKASLNWVTATEINNDYFTVEKSVDGVKWMFLSTVKGSGNSSRELSYQLTDNHPTLGANYYRLSQYDFNGDKEVLGIEAVQFDDDQLYNITVYPNPVIETLTIDVSGGDLDINEVCTLYNNEGKEVRSILVNSRQTKIDMSGLIKGVYHLKINNKHFAIVKN